MKAVLQIVLLIVIAGLSYLIYESIQQPIRFQEKRDVRAAAVVGRLKSIRDLQVAYKSVNSKYTGSFDTLIDFAINGRLPLVKMEGSLTDSMVAAGVSEAEALKKGIIKRDTVYISVKDSLLKTLSADSIRFVPYTDKATFQMAAASITTGSGVVVPVFEAKVTNKVYLNGLDEQEIINMNDKANKLARFPGLQVGSVEEANNNAGNWE